jgi:hypothetical protein
VEMAYKYPRTGWVPCEGELVERPCTGICHELDDWVDGMRPLVRAAGDLAQPPQPTKSPGHDPPNRSQLFSLILLAFEKDPGSTPTTTGSSHPWPAATHTNFASRASEYTY